jgi:hypothetical protein
MSIDCSWIKNILAVYPFDDGHHHEPDSVVRCGVHRMFRNVDNACLETEKCRGGSHADAAKALS